MRKLLDVRTMRGESMQYLGEGEPSYVASEMTTLLQLWCSSSADFGMCHRLPLHWGDSTAHDAGRIYLV